MEKLARQQYLKNKNPKDCALLYIALNRVQVLAGLFKLSKDEKDKPLVGFLSRNFQVFGTNHILFGMISSFHLFLSVRVLASRISY